MKTNFLLTSLIILFSFSAQADIYDRINKCEKKGGGPCLYNILRELADSSTPNTGDTITSDGTAQAPHCSWNSVCQWDGKTKRTCAEKLCQAAGYSGGKFVKASNNMCNSGFTNFPFHYYSVDQGAYFHGNPANEAQITATCN